MRGKSILIIMAIISSVVIAGSISPVFIPETNSVIHDSIRYEFTPLGAVRIWEEPMNSFRSEKLAGAMGYALTGNIGASEYYALVSDFSWVWWNDTIIYNVTEFNFNSTDAGDINNATWNYTREVSEVTMTGYNLNPDFNWTQQWFFKTWQPVKITNTITNNLVDVNNFKMWFINTVELGSVIEHNGNDYVVDFDNPLVLEGNFNNLLANARINDIYTFDYYDLIANGFNITNIIIGNASFIDLPETIIMAIGVQNNTGELNIGDSILFDPSVTPFKNPEQTNYSQNEWGFPENVSLSDDRWANSSGVGDEFNVGNFSFNLPVNATIEGIEVRVEALEAASLTPPCVGPSPEGTLGVRLSGNDGVSYTTSKRVRWLCTDGEVYKSFGDLEDLWGRDWNASNLSNQNFTIETSITLLKNGGTFNPGVDNIQVRINWSGAADTNLVIIDLKDPINGSFIDTLNPNLNWTIFNATPYEIWVYADDNDTDLMNHLVYHRTGQQDGNFIYNFSTAVTDSFVDSLVSLYHLDNNPQFGENATLVFDFAGGDLNGTVLGGAVPVENGKLAGAYLNPSTDDRIKIGTGTDYSTVCLGDGCSFGGWFNLTSAAGTNVMISRWDVTDFNNFFRFYMSGSSTLAFELFESGVAAEGKCQISNSVGSVLNVWHHFFAIYSNLTNSTNLYFDGELVEANDPCDFDNINAPAWTDPEDTCIGIDCDDLTSDFRGEYDEVSLWNKPLNSNEIADLYRLREGKYFWNVTIDREFEGIFQNATNEFTIGSCGYTNGVGDYTPKCSDNCTLDIDLDVGDNDIQFIGPGAYTISPGVNVTYGNKFSVINQCLLSILSPAQILK